MRRAADRVTNWLIVNFTQSCKTCSGMRGLSFVSTSKAPFVKCASWKFTSSFVNCVCLRVFFLVHVCRACVSLVTTVHTHTHPSWNTGGSGDQWNWSVHGSGTETNPHTYYSHVCSLGFILTISICLFIGSAIFKSKFPLHESGIKQIYTQPLHFIFSHLVPVLFRQSAFLVKNRQSETTPIRKLCFVYIAMLWVRHHHYHHHPASPFNTTPSKSSSSNPLSYHQLQLKPLLIRNTKDYFIFFSHLSD